MNKNKPYRELATLIANRSICQVQVGALIYDSIGIISWGWNHSGSGMGCHAEIHAIKRANKRRLKHATILVMGIRRRKLICSFPCPRCFCAVKASGIKFVECLDQNKKWGIYSI